ncbi:uncharacterized protein A4U43_C04F34340 [Asparagus officinalis]|uniref:Uncharacterized protein n=1 Tax=Asparagus officinalis TaxID=4686 RepID=A0A5P1F5R9_ASPOF|nr:uncharacterized protein A4U43_C04F34340 [Asparagus officinalis]
MTSESPFDEIYDGKKSQFNSFIDYYREKNPIILNGVETPNFNVFTSRITLHIPNTEVIELIVDPKTDKKTANDSSAFVMLRELQKRGRCFLEEQ